MTAFAQEKTLSHRRSLLTAAGVVFLPAGLVVGCAVLAIETATRLPDACSASSGVWGVVAALVLLAATATVSFAMWRVAGRIVAPAVVRLQLRVIGLICVAIVGAGAAGYVLLAVGFCGYQF